MSSTKACSAHTLHRELNVYAAQYAARYGLQCEMTSGSLPSLVFSAGGEGPAAHHGNFHPASYKAIHIRPDWAQRLLKPHTGWRRAFARSAWQWRELDCAVSSDALLMNIFCYPRLLRSSSVAGLLAVAPDATPVFGLMPRLLKVRGLIDTTEIDMGLGDLLVEAKLTESGFQKAAPPLLARYAEWQTILDPALLDRHVDGAFANYQLLRGILAAAAGRARFCLLCDARRADLMEQWFHVMRAVRSAEVRCRLTLLTWQELAAAAPRPLARWLAEKYGFESAHSAASSKRSHA